MSRKIPVILDTDIGVDIDDAWALALILKSPELDLKLVLTDMGDPAYRGALAACYLMAAGRTEVPIGLGVVLQDEGVCPQKPWLGNFIVSDYPGPVYEDGVGALINVIMASPEPVTLICIGPVPNIRAALAREPRIVGNARIVGMFGSVRYGHLRDAEIVAENNVRLDVDACRQLFEAFPSVTITPLDTCGIVQLKDEVYRRVRNCNDPLIQTLIESYRSWEPNFEWGHWDPVHESSILFDTVAVYLAIEETFLVMENLGIRITDDGFTKIDEHAKSVRCASDWRDLAGFEQWLLQRFTRDCV